MTSGPIKRLVEVSRNFYAFVRRLQRIFLYTSSLQCVFAENVRLVILCILILLPGMNIPVALKI